MRQRLQGNRRATTTSGVRKKVPCACEAYGRQDKAPHYVSEQVHARHRQLDEKRRSANRNNQAMMRSPELYDSNDSNETEEDFSMDELGINDFEEL